MPAKSETPHEPRVPGGKTDEAAAPKKPFRTPAKNMSEPAPDEAPIKAILSVRYP